jgi:hypothetical protein
VVGRRFGCHRIRPGHLTHRVSKEKGHITF